LVTHPTTDLCEVTDGSQFSQHYFNRCILFCFMQTYGLFLKGSQRSLTFSSETYNIPLTFYLRRGSRGASDIPPRRPSFTKMTLSNEELDGRAVSAIAEAKHRSQWLVLGWVTKIYYLELFRASEGTLSRWSRLHLQSLAPNPVSRRFDVRQAASRKNNCRIFVTT
jgi:hypothetical protein